MENIIEIKERKELLKMVDDLIERPDKIKSSILLKNHWVALPMESGSHFDEKQAEKIAEALSALKVKIVYAIQSELWDNSELEIYKFIPTKEEILNFSANSRSSYFVLFSKELSFLIVCSVYDFFVVAGTKEFVTKSSGNDLEASRKQFLNFAQDSYWDNDDKAQFMKVYNYYIDFG
jgi:hypothetical protein